MKKFNEIYSKDKEQKAWDGILDNINKKKNEFSLRKTASAGKTFPNPKTEEIKKKLLQKQKDALKKPFSSLSPKKKLDMKKLHPIFIEFRTVKRMKEIAMYLVSQGYKVYNYKKLMEEESVGKYEFFESVIEDGKYVFKRTNKSHGDVINFTTLKGIKGRIENKTVDPFGEEQWGFEKIEESYGLYESRKFQNFKVGDRVRITDDGLYKNLEATLLYVATYYAVAEFDEKIFGGHDGGQLGKDGFYRYVDLSNIEKIDDKSKILKPEIDPFAEEKWYESKKQKIKNYTDYILEEYEGGPPAKPQVTVKNKTVEWVLSDEEEEEPKELRILWNDSKLDNFE